MAPVVETIELTKRVSDTGIQGVLIVTPYYSRPSQAGLADREDIGWANIMLAEISRGELTPPLQAELRSNRSGKYTIQATKLKYERAN